MHEFSLATQIVESVLSLVESNREGGEVLKVELLIGELAGIDAGQLRFCYNSITRETPLEHSVLEIASSEAQVRCRHCCYCGPPRYLNGALARARIPTFQCPRCGNSVEATQGHECELRSVQFFDEAWPANVT
jgi:hydrogenase nickel incorporation protein HypA/HybF